MSVFTCEAFILNYLQNIKTIKGESLEMKKQFNLLATAVLSVLASNSAQAIQFDGFMTAGASKIVSIDDADKGNIYIGGLGDRGITEDLTFEKDTRFGLQISSDVSENMSVVAQILGRGDQGNFNAIVEWAYIDYAINDEASIHVGKIKQPVYLVNDYIEVGYAYPWIRPPQEVYYSNNPLNTVNGIELLLQFPVGPGTCRSSHTWVQTVMIFPMVAALTSKQKIFTVWM